MDHKCAKAKNAAKRCIFCEIGYSITDKESLKLASNQNELKIEDLRENFRHLAEKYAEAQSLNDGNEKTNKKN